MSKLSQSQKKPGRFAKLKSWISKGARALLPVAASMIVGSVAGPVAGIAAKFISQRLVEYNIHVPEEKIEKVTEDFIKKKGTKELTKQLEKLVGKKEGEKVDPTVKAAVEYALRPFYSKLEEAVDYLRSNTDELKNQLARLGLDILRVEDTVIERTDRIIGTLKDMENKLDALVFDLFSYKGLSVEQYELLCKNWMQMVDMSSRYDIGYTPELYVPRGNTDEIFKDFMKGLNRLVPKNLFLVLADAGMGKTWLLAHLATSLVNSGELAFFIKARDGVMSQLTQIFSGAPPYKIPFVIDELYEKRNKPVYLFIDGLDETDRTERLEILQYVLSLRGRQSVGIILSCRLSDWMYSSEIKTVHDSIDDMTFCISMNNIVKMPVSVVLEEFTDKELSTALTRYNLPKLPAKLWNLAKKPYILRCIAEWYWTRNTLPDPKDKDFGAMILERLSILWNPFALTQFKKLIMKIASNPNREVPLDWVNENMSDDVKSMIISSGITRIVKKSGMDYVIKLHKDLENIMISLVVGEAPPMVLPKAPEKKVEEKIISKVFLRYEDPATARKKKVQLTPGEYLFYREEKTDELVLEPIDGSGKIIRLGIKDKFVSRKNKPIRFLVRQDSLELENKGMTNEVIVNGKELKKYESITLDSDSTLIVGNDTKFEILFT